MVVPAPGELYRRRPATLDPDASTLHQSVGVRSGVHFAPPVPTATRRRRGWPLTLFGTGVLIGWMYALTVHANSSAVNSDAATVALEGNAIASGHILLHGWTLSLDSWWTLDAAFYTAANLAVGMRPVLLLAIPALIAALVVVVAVVIGRRGRRGPAATAGTITVLAVLALPTRALAGFFMAGPIHVSTALYALTALWALRRDRVGWGWLAAVILLAAGLLGDLQMLSYGVIPALIGGVVAMARRRSLRAGATSVAAAACSVALALTVRDLVNKLGGFKIGAANQVSSTHQILLNVKHVLPGLVRLLGLSTSRRATGGVPMALEWVHVIVAAVLAACLLAGMVRMLHGAWRGSAPADPGGSREPEPWRLDDLLVVASIGPALNFIVLSGPSLTYLRYLTATVIFATALAGRLVTLWWAGSQGRSLRRPAIFVGVISTACFVAASGFQLSQPAPPTPAAELVSFLEAHNLTSGVGDFWAASITTVESGGTVTVRPLASGPNGELEGYNRGDVLAWFPGRSFQFVVYPQSNGDDNPVQVSLSTATNTWGPPSERENVAGYTILQWGHTITVSASNPGV